MFDSGDLHALGAKFVFAHPWGLPNTLVVVLRTTTGMNVFDYVYTPLCEGTVNTLCRHDTLTFQWIPRVRFTFPSNDTVFLGELHAGSIADMAATLSAEQQVAIKPTANSL